MSVNEMPRRLIAYQTGPALPGLRPASARRGWMDETPNGFAYRCLPMTVANAHGWEVIGDTAFEAWWNGGSRKTDIVIRPLGGGAIRPMSHFGSGILTFPIDALLRTEPGIGLWVSGPPNSPKDGIMPLSGLVETDWAPMTFTMNWRFTRPDHVIRFEAGEAICFFFPLDRGLIGRHQPQSRPITEDAALEAAHRGWRQGRRAFNEALHEEGSPERAKGWQKDYHRAPGIADHITKPRVLPFPPLP